jgi:glycolate oxidase FAD binding subunit
MSARAGTAAWPPELASLVARDEDPARFTIGGRPPEAVLVPDSVPAAGSALRAAARAGLAVAPLGGGTECGQLAAPRRPFVALLTRRLAGVVEHAAPDLTVVVQSGTTIASLASALATHGQRLPLDAPRPERSTVGGLVAAGRSGPLRLGHGTVRDYLIGIAVLDGEGNLVRAGGRVVKNVAGYDLMKLHAGARGTLGMIVEAAFKVKPISDDVACVVSTGSPELAAVVRVGLRRAQVPAVALELVMAGAGAGARGIEDGCRLVIGLEGVAAEIDWQAATAGAVLAAAGGGPAETLRGAPARELLRWLAEFPSGPAAESGMPPGPPPAAGLLLRAAVLPSRTPELWRAFQAAAPGARLAASAGSGVVRLALPHPSSGEFPAALTAGGPAIVGHLRSLALELGGHAVVDALPEQWEGEADRFGSGPDPLAVRLKAQLDPHALFLPGSYLGLGAEAVGGAAGAGTAHGAASR